MFAPSIYEERRDTLRSKFKSGLILMLGNSTSPINYPGNAYKFRQDSNFLYYFGIDQPNWVGIIDIDNGHDTLYANDFTIDDIIWMGVQPKVKDIAEKVKIQNTRSLHDVGRELSIAVKSGRRIHFLPPYRGKHFLTIGEWLGIRPDMLSNYVSKELIMAVIAQRSIKQMCEIEELDRAADIGFQMHVTAMRMAQVGCPEQVIADALEGIAASYGHMTSFSSIISQHGETLHNEVHNGILEEGRLLLVDCGAESKMHYASDNTRTIPVGGRFTDRQLPIYNLVLEALEEGMRLAKPGVTYRSVHDDVCRLITKGLQDLGLMKGDVDDSVQKGAHALFMPHGLGHMMGLDTHDMEGLGEDYVGYDCEVQRSTQFGTANLRLGRRLQEGFVITVEPGIYFIPALIEKWKSEQINKDFIEWDNLEEYYDFGGIRLEEDILITEEGNRMLGKQRIPIRPDDVMAEVELGRRDETQMS